MQLVETDRIISPKAAKKRDVLKDRLGAQWDVVEVEVYENVIDASPKEDVVAKLQKGAIDYITFTSASTVQNFMHLVGEAHKDLLQKVKLVSIGEITSKEMVVQGLVVSTQPANFTRVAMINRIFSKKEEEQRETVHAACVCIPLFVAWSVRQNYQHVTVFTPFL